MFSTRILSAAAACSVLFSSVHAHMKITSPIPYGQSSLNNSPLEADGSDFPCKQRSGVYDMTKMNSIEVGVPQTLSFEGGATHGGGSCQLSVTMDQSPTKDSEWKVIHSILGGCPNSAAGNADGSPTYDQNPTFTYTMPRGMPNGKYTIAWTWFNKIGNREMYMNCAPIEVSGGADNNDVYDTLPDMFVANIGQGCTTSEGQDFVFPDCGLNVETAQKTALGSSTMGTCAAATGRAGSGSGSGGAQTTAAGSAPSPTGDGGVSSAAPSYGGGSSFDDGSYKPYLAAAPGALSYGSGSGSGRSSAAAKSPAPTANGLGTKTQLVYETTFATITATDAPSFGSNKGSVSGYGINRGKANSSNADGTTSSTSCDGGSIACPVDGAIVCMESGKWGLCDHGCAVPRDLAQGTTCSNGVISKRDMSAHIRKHMRPHAHKF